MSSHADDGDDRNGQLHSGLQESESTPARGKSEGNVRRSQEAVKTLLSSFGENAEQCSDEFARQDVKFRDLSALTEEDLHTLGVTDPETQSAMIEQFEDLPNQDMYYDRICASAEAQEFNEQILGRSETHLNSMNTSLSAAYLKMLVSPSNDVIVDDSIFASRFVLEALDELKKSSEDMEDRLRTLEQIAIRNAKSKLANQTAINLYKSIAIIGGLGTGVTIALWFWKGR